jgi:hypothetical protein
MIFDGTRAIAMKVLAQQFNSFLTRVKETGLLTAPQFTDLIARVEELKESSERIGRKDYRLVVIGGLVGFFLEHGLTSDIARTLFHLSGEVFLYLARHLPELLK